MKRPHQALERFLEAHHDGRSPLLGAISGGGDSLTLLHALAQSPFKKFVQVIHVNHQWRKESGKEAEKLKELAGHLEIPCYIESVEREVSEDGARNQRLAIYGRYLAETGAQAVLLAHHRGDVAETCFKRLIEGAPLPKLAGIRPVSTVEGVPLWRPFLNLDKQDLTATPIALDATNDDPTFHRGLLRTKLFPYLEKALQRPLLPNLARLSSEAALLTDYLDDEAAPYLQNLHRSPLGLYLKLTDLPHPFLLAHIVRTFCKMGKITLSRESVETTVGLLLDGTANRQKDGLYIDRRRLFLFRPPPPLPTEPLPLSLGTHRFGPWVVEVAEGTSKQFWSWEALWTGEATIALPAGELSLVSCSGNRCLTKYLNANRVPAFLWSYLPIILKDERIVLNWKVDTPTRYVRLSLVDVATMSELYDKDKKFVIRHLVEDPIVA